MPRPTVSPRRRGVVRALVPCYLLVIFGGPLAVASAGPILARSDAARIEALAVSPALFVFAFAIIAGALSRITLHAITSGKFPRDLGHDVYGPRRLHALCWTAIYYSGPIYHAILAVPALRAMTLRLFGYRGSLDFQTYPDTWIRDLPLLSIGSGAYLSNKATVSPNMCLRNGKIIVLPLAIGERTMIGHLAMIAPGVEIGDDSEIGVGAAVGVKARVGRNTLIDHEAVLDHEAVVGDDCVIGNGAYVGRRAVIHDGVRIPPRAVIPARAVIRVDDDILASVAG